MLFLILLIVIIFSKGVIGVLTLSALKQVLMFLSIILSNGIILLLLAMVFRCIT